MSRQSVVSSPFPVGPFGRDNGEEVAVADVDEYAETLQHEFTGIANQLSRDARAGLETKYCIDFDVVRSAIREDRNRHERSLWSSAFLAAASNSIFALPGLLYETLKFLTQKISVASRKPSNAFVSFFENQIDPSSSFDAERSNRVFEKALSDFKSRQIRKREFYALNLLRMSIENTETRLPSLDYQKFRFCSSFLAKGSRADRWINNRVDAINYSLVDSLNQESSITKIRYIIVSNSINLSRLDRSAQATFSHRAKTEESRVSFVLTPREATIRQLILRSAGGSLTDAEKLAFELASKLANFRALIRNSSKGESSHATKKRVALSQSIAMESDSLIGLFSEFDELDAAFKADDFSHLSPDLDVDFSDFEKRPSVFYKDLSDRISKAVEGGKYSHALDAEDLGETNILVRKIKNGNLNRFGHQFKFTDSLGNDFAFALVNEKITIYSFRKIAFSHFLNIINNLKSSVIDNVQTGEIEPEQGWEVDRVTIGIDGVGVAIKTIPSNSGYSLDRLALLFDIIPDKIHFIRIDNAMFTASREDDMIAFSTNKDIRSQLEYFLDECADVPYQDKVLTRAVARFFTLSKFF